MKGLLNGSSLSYTHPCAVTPIAKDPFNSSSNKLQTGLPLKSPAESGSIHCQKKLSHVDLKNWVTGGTKIRPGIPSSWRIFESNFDSQYRVNLTLNIGSIWLSISGQFDSQYRVNLTLNIGLIWLSISGQFDSQYRVNLTQIF